MDYKNVFDRFEGQDGFIKTIERPSIDRARKAELNRKGNVMYNSGDIEGARRIFLTTGYSDGLTRVGDYYKSQGRSLDALRMYWIAPDRKKSNAIIMQVSAIIQSLIHEDEDRSDE